VFFFEEAKDTTLSEIRQTSEDLKKN
jgi:hypothetical protein